MVSRSSPADDGLTDGPVANKNLALNSIIGAAFGGLFDLSPAQCPGRIDSVRSCWSTMHGALCG